MAVPCTAAAERAEAATTPQLLTLSAATEAALEESTRCLCEFLSQTQSVDMRDLAFTLQSERAAQPFRRMLVCSDREDAATVLTARPSSRLLSGQVAAAPRPLVFLLPGVGDQYVGMAHELYRSHIVFREEIDRCAQLLEPHLGVDIRTVLYPENQRWKQSAAAGGIDLKRMIGRKADDPPDPDTVRLNTTLYAQPTLFAIEYAMAQLWLSLGIAPDAMVGHSMGEYLAACLAGVMSLADTLRLIAVRAKLVNELPQALMLAVMATEEELRPYLQSGLFISLINGPTHCVVAGPPAEVAALEEALEAKDIIARRVQNGHAFHTVMMAPILGAFEAELRKTPLRAPRIPYISNVTGNWITAAQATDPAYWLQHLTQTARFDQALQALWRLANPVLVECGPGRTLSVLAAQHPDRKGTLQAAIWSIRQRYENESDEQVLLSALGKVWLAGAAVCWERARTRGAEPQRLALPMPAPEPESLAQSSESSAPQPQPQADEPGVGPPNPRERELIAIWQTALGRDVGVNDSFGALGGDSLNSIGALMEMKRAGLPDEVARGLYQGLTIRQMVRQEAELASGAAPRSFNAQIPLSSVEMPVFIRAVGIYLVVASHLGITGLLGNPMLMIVSGLSFAKFQLLAVSREGSIRPVLRFMLRIAIPAMLDTLARQLAHHSFHPRSFLLMDNLQEPHPFGPHQSPWFIDLLLQNFLIAALPLTIAPVRRFAASRPYAYGMIFLCVSWAASIVIPLFFDQQHVWLMVPHVFMWLLAFGWCAAYSRSYKQKLLASILLVCFNTISKHWGHAFEWEAVAAALALTWLDELPAQIPTVLVRLISAVAAASLFIYLTHFVCYYAIQALWTHVTGRPLSEFPPLWSIPFIMAGGYVAWRIWNYGTRVLLRWLGQKPKLSSEPAGSW